VLRADVRRERMAFFDQLKASRLAQLDTIADVRSGALRLTGWTQVLPGAVAGQMGYDRTASRSPSKPYGRSWSGWASTSMTGRPPARLRPAGRKRTGEQRLVEVKGLAGPLGPVWLEQNEWAQAQQRGTDYWLYVLPSARHHQWSLCARRILPRRSAARAASSGSRSASTTFADGQEGPGMNAPTLRLHPLMAAGL